MQYHNSRPFNVDLRDELCSNNSQPKPLRIEDIILSRKPTARYDITTLQIFNVHSKGDEKPA